MRRGFLYLVAIMDWYGRKVLAWRLSNTMEADFCVAALEDAIARYGTPDIFNTDQGSQFTSFAFIVTLKDAGIAASYFPYGYVAHGFGSVDDVILTNSREAFAASYEAGFRIFETDLLLLADGTAIAVHDQHEQCDGFNGRFVDASWEDVKGLRYRCRYNLRCQTGHELIFKPDQRFGPGHRHYGFYWWE